MADFEKHNFGYPITNTDCVSTPMVLERGGTVNVLHTHLSPDPLLGLYCEWRDGGTWKRTPFQGSLEKTDRLGKKSSRRTGLLGRSLYGAALYLVPSTPQIPKSD